MCPGDTAVQRPGSTVELSIIRGKKPMKIKVKIGEMPAKYAGLEPGKKQAVKSAKRLLGLSVSEITPDLQQALDLPKVKGVVVTDVDADSPAAGKLSRGDVITRINGKPVRSLDDYEKILETAKKAKTKFLIIRVAQKSEEGETLYTVVDVPTNW